MSDPSTYWLTFTNAALGVVVLICCIAVGIGVFQEIAAKRKKASVISNRMSNLMSNRDREVAGLANSYPDGHAFHFPELGVTMADGGEEIGKKEK